jgi:phage tail sheath protein FI
MSEDMTMPATLTYPGVYVEEIPSGVHTITGVATSITAFAGWAASGPTDVPGLVLSYADYTRRYGGLDSRSPMSYAVAQFFNNGGARAYIVRLLDPAAKAGAVTLDGKLTLTAVSAGDWSGDYAVTIRASSFDATRFTLAVVTTKANPAGQVVESFENLSMQPADPRYVVSVLAAASALVDAATTQPPDTVLTAAGAIPTTSKLTGGKDGAVLAPDAAAFDTALLPPAQVGGLYQLDRIDLFNILCVPGETNPATIASLEKFARDRRAFLIADCSQDATGDSLAAGPGAITGDDAINAAFYFPWVVAPDPLQQNRPAAFPPCGFMAGIYARTDTQRGVWKAPAGIDASLTGVLGTRIALTNDENGTLNPLAINCLRTFPVYGTVAWGARTLQGNDERGSDWKYIPVRRTALFIEESLRRGTQWVVFEPNDEPLWAQIRLNVGAFLHDLFRQGAFQGATPQDAYFVKCDGDTTTQNDINAGIVNIIVGFAPLKPAEFVVLQLQQIAGQIQT